MPPKKKIDETALLKLIQDGVPQKQIMDQLRIKTGTQLKVAYTDALMNSGQVPALQADRPRKSKTPKNIISVNKHGSLVIAKAIVDQFDLREGDAFDLIKTKSGLSLQPAAPKPVVKLRKKANQ